jgi:dynein assembly factor 3
MDTVTMMGYIQFWGLSPALDLLADSTEPKTGKAFLLSGVSDLRHLMKTLADNDDDEEPFTFYFHETQKELICRALLMLHLLHESALSEQELLDLFLDLYGNSLLRERSLDYLHEVVPHLKHFVHDDLAKARTVLPQLVVLDGLKYAERDDLSSILESWGRGATF